MPESYPKTTQKNEPSQRNPLWYDVQYPAYINRNQPLRATNQTARLWPQGGGRLTATFGVTLGKNPKRATPKNTDGDRYRPGCPGGNESPTVKATPPTHPPDTPATTAKGRHFPGREDVDRRSNPLI